MKKKTGLNLRQINALTAWTLNLISEQYPAEYMGTRSDGDDWDLSKPMS